MVCNCRQATLRCETYNASNDELLDLKNLGSPEFAMGRYTDIRLTFNMSTFTVRSRYFQPLNRLLAKPTLSDEPLVSVTITFAQYHELILSPMAFDGIFDDFSQNATKLSLEFYSLHPTVLHPDTFRHLSVGYLDLFGSNVKSNNEDGGELSFERLFNHTSVSRLLRLEGIILANEQVKSQDRSFFGSIRRLQYSKQVDIINSNEYPQFPVPFYAISAHNPRNIVGRSFENYTNLGGLAIHGGNIDLNAAKLRGLNYLEELDLNIEQIDNRTLQPVALNLKVLVLGANLKHISPDNLESIGKTLRTIDIRNVDFNQLSYPSICALTDLVNKRRDDLEVMIDRHGCDCHQAFILHMKKLTPLCHDRNLVGRCAQYAHCQLVRNYFSSIQSSTDHRPIRPWLDYVDSTYLGLNSSRLPGSAASQGDKPYGAGGHSMKILKHEIDKNSIPAIVVDVDHDPFINGDTDVESGWILQDGKPIYGDIDTMGMRQNLSSSKIVNGSVRYPTRPTQSYPNMSSSTMQWIPIVIVCAILIISLMVALLIWHLNFKRRRRGNFKPVPRDATL